MGVGDQLRMLPLRGVHRFIVSVPLVICRGSKSASFALQRLVTCYRNEAKRPLQHAAVPKVIAYLMLSKSKSYEEAKAMLGQNQPESTHDSVSLPLNY